MINDYINGYVAALNSLDITLDEYINEVNHLYYSEDNEYYATIGYNNIKNYIKQQKENYKQLVKELNEAQSKKTTP